MTPQKSKSRSAGDADRLFLCGIAREKDFDGLALVWDIGTVPRA